MTLLKQIITSVIILFFPMILLLHLILLIHQTQTVYFTAEVTDNYLIKNISLPNTNCFSASEICIHL